MTATHRSPGTCLVLVTGSGGSGLSPSTRLPLQGAATAETSAAPCPSLRQLPRLAGPQCWPTANTLLAATELSQASCLSLRLEGGVTRRGPGHTWQSAAGTSGCWFGLPRPPGTGHAPEDAVRRPVGAQAGRAWVALCGPHAVWPGVVHL